MDLVSIYLREAIEKDGCPVCRLLEKFEKDEIETILYEHVNNPSIREEFKKSLGLCPYHAWRLFETASSNPLYGGLGVAIIYEHMLRTYIKDLKNENPIREGECYLCTLIEGKERLTIKAMSDRMKELLPVYEKADSVLCKRHYELLLAELEKQEPEMAERLKRLHLKKLEELRKLVEGFIENSDYRSKRGPSREEATAIRLSIEALKGKPLAINTLKFGKTKRKKGIRVGWKV